MTKSGSLSILAAAMIVGLGAGQSIAAPAHSSPGHTAADFGTRSVLRGIGTGGDHWIRPDCLQPEMLVQTSRGMVWEPKAQCTY
jgi:hypothetical protein